MWFGVISVFPEMFEALTHYGVSGRAVKQGLVDVRCFNPRDYTHDRHQTVDDRPYGGGPGMVMKIEPLKEAIAEAKREAEQATGDDPVKVIYLSPQGQPLKQSGVRQLADRSKLILLAGRYEGVDERLLQTCVDEEWSLGDFVLSGGEIPAMALMDAVIRLQPNVLGHDLSAQQDSFMNGLLDCPHYTRPESFEGAKVPEVLLSGDHERIRSWRLEQSLARTYERRPDLLEKLALNEEQQHLLAKHKSKT